jgi:Neutral/alkaline non-lysosomal ceramidase, N-terminal/Concanavalin A-like lectin/glucanases superfamily
MLPARRPSLSAIVIALALALPSARAELRVGAAVVDITPNQLPVLVNGGMLTRSVDSIHTRINARAIVLNDGQDSIGIVVVDSCMVPRVLLDDAKQKAAAQTKLKPEHILISATHTHSAPSAFAALGTEADAAYVPFLREKITEALVAAEANLRPARVGWGSGSAPEFTALRRWVRRPDRVEEDPFGNPSVRANMHAASNPENVTGPSGPEDPELSIIAFQSLDGEPIAALANFSMHYFSDQAISADYFGLFCESFQTRLKEQHPKANMVVALSHGCSGDIWRRDYMTWAGKDQQTIEGYTQGLLAIAMKVYADIEYQADADLEMAEASLPMKYRVPDKQRLQWAENIVATMENNPPKDTTEVYAREQLLLNQMRETEIIVQALRIGDIAITTTPNETYALTGLKLKAFSPLARTMVIELANGADGYIPPPEQHHLGGYNTWAARSAGLEVTAEPRIVGTNLALLEKVTGLPRRGPVDATSVGSQTILNRQPVAYYRLAEVEGPIAVDSSGHGRHATYEPGVCFYLEGPAADFASQPLNRCAHFAGGRMLASLAAIEQTYVAELSFWNGMPNDGRATAGWLLSRDYPHAISQRGEHLGVGGTATSPGRLILQLGEQEPLVGKTTLDRWTWYRVSLVRSQDKIQVFLNGSQTPEIEASVSETTAPPISTWFVGGRSDNDSNWEGRIDEFAVFKP